MSWTAKFSFPHAYFEHHAVPPDLVKQVTVSPPAVRRSIYPTTFLGRTADVIPVVLCALFILAGLAFVPYAGIQSDEALFTAPLYAPFPREFRARLFHHDVPLMLMSYVGTL